MHGRNLRTWLERSKQARDLHTPRVIQNRVLEQPGIHVPPHQASLAADLAVPKKSVPALHCSAAHGLMILAHRQRRRRAPELLMDEQETFVIPSPDLREEVRGIWCFRTRREGWLEYFVDCFVCWRPGRS